MAKALHNAAGYGSLDEIRRFLAAGVSVDQLDAEGNTPLLRACRFGQIMLRVRWIADGFIRKDNGSRMGLFGRTGA